MGEHLLNHSTNVPVASAPLPTRFHGGCATACFHATHIQQLPWKSFLDGLALPTAYATANYPVTYPSHLHQGTRRVGPSFHGQSRCRRRSMSCKLHGTRARGMMRRTTINERGARATGSKRTWGVGTKSRRRTRRGPNRQRGSSRGKAAGGRGRGICVARRYAGPPSSPRTLRQFRRSQPPRDGEVYSESA